MAVPGAALTSVAQATQVAQAGSPDRAIPPGPAPGAAAPPTVTSTADHAWPEVEAPGAAAGASIAAPTAAPPAPELPPSTPVAPGALDVDTIRRMWPEVLATLAGMKRTTWSLVSHYAQVLDFDGVSLVLGFDSTGRAQLFGKGAHQQYLSNALVEVLGLDCRFEAVSSDPVSGRPVDQPQPRADRPAPAPPPVEAAAVTESPAQVVAAQARPLIGSADGSADGTSPGAGQDSALGQGQPPGYDDIPPADEPPPDDEPPPEDSGRPETGPATAPANPPAQPPAAARTISLSDDEVSPDDPVIDGASLVGAAVVEQMLGGRIIEERSE